MNSYYRRLAYSPSVRLSYSGGLVDVDPPDQDDTPDDVYLEKMERILSGAPCIGVPPEPTKLSPNVYLGTSANAENLALLKSWKIAYLLNCAGTGSIINIKRTKDFYPEKSGILGYRELLMDDDTSMLRHHIDKAQGFIDYAQDRNARVLIYCPGVSRSGAIALAYLLRSGKPLLEATRFVKDRRRCVLTSERLMKQLVEFARSLRMLDPDVESVRAPKFYRRINSYRINSAHLPTYL